VVVERVERAHRLALEHVDAGLGGVVEQDVVEPRPVDVHGPAVHPVLEVVRVVEEGDLRVAVVPAVHTAELLRPAVARQHFRQRAAFFQHRRDRVGHGLPDVLTREELLLEDRDRRSDFRASNVPSVEPAGPPPMMMTS
jgi:hypothetical protein